MRYTRSDHAQGVGRVRTTAWLVACWVSLHGFAQAKHQPSQSAEAAQAVSLTCDEIGHRVSPAERGAARHGPHPSIASKRATAGVASETETLRDAVVQIGGWLLWAVVMVFALLRPRSRLRR